MVISHTIVDREKWPPSNKGFLHWVLESLSVFMDLIYSVPVRVHGEDKIYWKPWLKGGVLKWEGVILL